MRDVRVSEAGLQVRGAGSSMQQELQHALCNAFYLKVPRAEAAAAAAAAAAAGASVQGGPRPWCVCVGPNWRRVAHSVCVCVWVGASVEDTL